MELHPSMMAALAESDHEYHRAVLHPAIVAAMPVIEPKQRSIYVHPGIVNAEVVEEDDTTPSTDSLSAKTSSATSSDGALATPTSPLTPASIKTPPTSPRLRLRSGDGDKMGGDDALLVNEDDSGTAGLIRFQSAIRAQKARDQAADARQTFRAISLACLRWQQVTLDPRELDAFMATHIHEWDCGVELDSITDSHKPQFRPRHIPLFTVPSDAEIERVLRGQIMKWYRPSEHSDSVSVTAQEGFMAESSTERTLGLPQGWLASGPHWRLRGIDIVSSEVRQYWRRVRYEFRQDQAAARRDVLCISDCSTALQERNNYQVLGRPTRGDLDFSLPPHMSARAVPWVRVDENDQPLENDEVNAGVDYEEAFTPAQLADWRRQQWAGAQFRRVRDT